MTTQQQNLTQPNLVRAFPAADVVTELFYARLLELDPKLAQLFKGEMKAQGRQLMRVIGEALIWTFEKWMGKGFTPELKAAGVAVCTALAETESGATAGD